MKLNIPVRMKNPWFWIGLLGVVLTAMGVSPEMFTSWGIVGEQFMSLIKNPFMIGSVIVAILGVVLDPTTKGVTDSNQAMTYDKPKAD